MSIINLFLFYNGPDTLRIAVDGGVDGLVVDCECIGKELRQQDFDTEVNTHRPSEVADARAGFPNGRILCRINGAQASMEAMLADAAEAVEAGADEVILPMVEAFEPVHELLNAMHGRAGTGIMVETEWATAHAAALNELPLSRVFVGLHDLMVQRRSRHLFENLRNGTVEQLRRQFPSPSFGFGGLTVPSLGYPLPCRLLMAELARLETGYTFLRRSFFRDLKSTGMGSQEMVALIREEWDRLQQRPAADIAADHRLLDEKLDEILGAAAPRFAFAGHV